MFIFLKVLKWARFMTCFRIFLRIKSGKKGFGIFKKGDREKVSLKSKGVFRKSWV